MADTNRVQISWATEVTFGTVPAVALTDVRYTGESLTFNIANTVSGEIRSDRQITDLVQTGASAEGGVNFELSYANPPNAWLESALFGEFTTAVDIALTDISVAAADQSYNTVAGDFTAQNLNVGQWVLVRGFANAVNNGWKRVVSIAAAKLIVTSESALVDETAPVAATSFKGQMLRNGVTQKSFSIQRECADVAQFFIYRGMVVNNFSLTATAEAIVTGSIDFLGQDCALQGTSWGTGANVAAPANDVLNAVANFGAIWENGAPLSGVCVQEVGFTVANNLRGRTCIGSLGFSAVGAGNCDVTGTFNVYFVDDTFFDKFLAAAESSLFFSTTDLDGNSYMFSFPRIKLETDPGPQAGGQNADLMENMAWRAIRDIATNCTIQIDIAPKLT